MATFSLRDSSGASVTGWVTVRWARPFREPEGLMASLEGSWPVSIT